MSSAYDAAFSALTVLSGLSGRCEGGALTWEGSWPPPAITCSLSLAPSGSPWA